MIIKFATGAGKLINGYEAIMKVKPKEVLLNLPIVLLFNQDENIAEFAANINQLVHGKVKVKYEELGLLGERHVGLFYLQRNPEFEQLRQEFTSLIETEEIRHHYIEKYLQNKEKLEEDEEQVAPPEEEEHTVCHDCDALGMLHQKGLDHCICGDEWVNGKCMSKLGWE